MLLACLSCVVWLSTALHIGAEVLCALITPDSVLAHACCCFFGDRFSIIVLLVEIYSPHLYLHHVAATALDQIRVLRKEVGHYQLIHLFIFRSEYLLHFIFLQGSLAAAAWTFDYLAATT